MGWDFAQGKSRADMVKEILTPFDGQSGAHWIPIAHKNVNGILWSVWESNGNLSTRYILCSLLKNEKGFGWGYKSMTEEMGPAYYSCPLSFLIMTPEPENQVTNDWREGVKKWHSEQSREVAPGMTIRLKDNYKLKWFKVAEVGRSIRARSLDNGRIYRIPKSAIEYTAEGL